MKALIPCGGRGEGLKAKGDGVKRVLENFIIISYSVNEEVVSAGGMYPEGFIYHTLKILERGDRKCLK